MNWILPIVAMIAYRGKGGGFVTWGVLPEGKNNLAHGFGALLIGGTLGLLTDFYYVPIYAILWFLFTKPSTRPTHAVIDTGNGLLAATIRQLYIMPILLLTYYLGEGSAWFLLGGLLLGCMCWISGALYRRFRPPVTDGLELSEWITGAYIGALFYLLIGVPIG